MRAPKEIKDALARCTNLESECKGCAYEHEGFCFDAAMEDSLTYINRIEALVAKMEREVLTNEID